MTKHELKVGDPARITGYEGFNPNCNHMGTEGVITSITPDGFCDLETGKGIIRIGRISDLEPIPSPKDPFAPGEYVTCCCNNGLQNRKCGDTVKVTLMFRNLPEGWFCYEQFDEANAADKAYFRPATPEEIAAYKAKYETQETTLDPKPEPFIGSNPEPRITFTVGGQKFYVGQQVWSIESDDEEHIKIGDEFIVSGFAFHEDECRLAVRRPKSALHMFSLPKGISTNPPAPHEWKRGDWGRHKDGRKAFVCSAWRPHGELSPQLLMVSFVGEAITGFPASEFTFIGHTEAPE